MFLKSLSINSLYFINHQHRFLKTLSLKFSANGEPINVLEMVEEELPEPQDLQVLVQVLMAPINPSDINIIQGRYPLQPLKLPATAGNEFIGKIIKKGDKVENFRLDDHVVAFEPGLGTWSKYLLLYAKQVYDVPAHVPLPEAATLTVNPCTAYRMLKDFIHLKPGDCVIQNGANSAVGQAIHQLCSSWGFKSVGVVRDRTDIAKLKQYLLRLGATNIFTEEELLKTELFKTGCLPKPILALNCVGGESATNLAKLLDYRGVMVTYGGMSRKPITISTGPSIFKRLAFHGFWITDWNRENKNSPERTYMLNSIIKLIIEGKLKAPIYELIPFEQYTKYSQKVLELGDKTNKKFIFDMTKTKANETINN